MMTVTSSAISSSPASTTSLGGSDTGSNGSGGSSGYGSAMSSKKSSLASNGSGGGGGRKASGNSNAAAPNGPMSEHDLVPAGMARPGDRVPVITPSYTRAGESLRHTVPGEMQCSMFCGGRRCKYESASHWKPDQMALKGIFSHWVTEGLLAMARPNTQLLRDGGLLEEFKKHGIKSVINLQTPGEHASCGPKLDKSGFSYDPNDLMKNDIFFYNFAWKDFGDANMQTLLDMVKVLSFAMSEGKVAVHCHAGLGRTGVLIAAYLVYYLRVRSNDALRYLRHKRPGSVQTRKQIDCVKEFETFFLPQCLVFSNKPPTEVDRKLGRFTMDQHIKRQRMVIHGYEARTLKYIPKILHRLCERLLRLAGCGPEYSVDENNFTKQFLAFRYDDKGGAKLSIGASSSASATPSESMAVTRRSSRSFVFGGGGGGAFGSVGTGASVNNSDDDSSMANSMSASASSTPGMPTPSYGGTRPGSETNSYVQSCSSALSGVDDNRLDEILGDGIREQPLGENRVTRELRSHQDLRDAAAAERLPKVTAEAVYAAAMESHAEIMRRDEGSWATEDVLLMKQYRTELNFKLSAWDRVDTETNLFVLTALLFEWMEHLKAPLLDNDSITYVVIYCDNIDSALKRLNNGVCYVVEYLARFVARLQPLSREKSENLMLRIIAALTHQSVEIAGSVHPSAKRFPKLRNGTADSTKKFMMRLFDIVRRQHDEGRLVASGVGARGGGGGMLGGGGHFDGFQFGPSTFASLNASSSSMITNASVATTNNHSNSHVGSIAGGRGITFDAPSTTAAPSAANPFSSPSSAAVTVNALVHRQPSPSPSSAAATNKRVTSGRRAVVNNNNRDGLDGGLGDEDDDEAVEREAERQINELDKLEAELPTP